jgi:hypothetical protein
MPVEIIKWSLRQTQTSILLGMETVSVYDFTLLGVETVSILLQESDLPIRHAIANVVTVCGRCAY